MAEGDAGSGQVPGKQVLETRAALYSFFSSLHLEPLNPNIAAVLKEKKVSALLGSSSYDLPSETIEGIRLLEESASSIDQSEIDNLAVEFTKLFRGVKKGYSPPPPYESVYKEGRVMGDSSIAVKNDYRKFGLDLSQEYKGEPPDHVAFELEFMSLLCTKELESFRKGESEKVDELRNKQREFLKLHLGSWLPGFYEKLKEMATHSFYTTVASATESFVRFEMENV
jgi:TorA maturation chaperone TorD